ncbi:Transient receptor potential channel pyrexia [Portunus trituberculatus]|uniref:Transient receptor potential channel pyrexia n=1 Tax=Portunus trituberculatus TaxID=210409 RepID=A0A5B7DVG7_PORTR|nr:Transient receptor potential channel pyrexia [Portunus trituberculatus]
MCQCPCRVVAEGILASEWWTAAFFVEEEEKDHKSDTEDDSEYLDTQGRSPYCTNFHEMIKSHPNLALKALDHCHANLPPESGQNHDFRLFEDNMCSEAGMKHSRRSHTPMAGWRLLQDHPVSLMMMKEECPGLLQHPFTDSWLRHFWRTSVFYSYTILLIIEVLYLVSLHFFMDNVDNWVQIQHKCNTTQEQFCRLSSSPGTAEVALHHTDTTQGGPLLGMAVAQVDSNFRCSQRTSLWQWIFVVVMTVTIASLECIYVYREWQWHFGIVGLLLEWILIIGRLNELPVLFVFMPITRRFLFGYIKALLYVTSLLFAFSYIFQLLLDDHEAFDSRPKAMVKMIVWLFGDLNYDSTFVEKPPLHPIMTTQMFVAFIIIMFGFIANLAVTLPSDRLEEFRKDAAFFQKLTQSTLLLEIQACFPWSLCQKLNDKDDKHKSNRIITWINKTLQEIFSADIIQISKKRKDNPLQELEQQVATLVDMCREQGKEVKELRQQLDILYKFMAERD